MQSELIKRITVVGAGTMGHGICQEFARGGFPVTICDISESILHNALGKIERNLNQMVGWGLMTACVAEAALGRISTTTSLEEAAKDSDLVIEAVVEDLELKLKVFHDLDRVCPERTVLASNSSSFMPSTLAAATDRPDRVLVLHFFFPPHLIPLVEIVRSEQTTHEVVENVYVAAKKAGKSPVIAQKEAPGFIANRIQSAILHEALYIVEQGIASAQDVDIAVKQGFGRRLGVAGPIEMSEVQDGWDVMAQIQGTILPDLDSSREPSPLILEKIRSGELGAKSGKGFYEWTPENLDTWYRTLSKALVAYMKPADR